MADMTTPLKRVRGLGSARSGTHHFWHQRLTALANVPLVIFFVILMISLAGESHEVVLDRLASPWVAIVFVLTMISISYHMRLGMQVIIEDYVHAPATKIAAVFANNAYAVVVAVACLYAVLRIGFGQPA